MCEIAWLVCAMAWLLTASSAGAAGIPGPPEPDVFSGDFGIELAKNHADGSSVLDSIEDIADPRFPWNGGFTFPANPPARPDSAALPEGLPRGLGFGSSSGSDGSVGGGSAVPEPEPAILLALGLAAVGMTRRLRTA
jgi:hypothetical protein